MKRIENEEQLNQLDTLTQNQKESILQLQIGREEQKNDIKTLHPIQYLPKIQLLVIQNFSESDFAPIQKLLQLKSISIENCEQFQNPQIFSQCEQIEQVTIVGSKMKYIHQILKLQNIKYLTLKNCKQLYNYNPLKNIQNLVRLTLHKLHIKQLYFQYRNKLQLIQIKDCAKFFVIENLSNCPELQQLEINETALENVPSLVNLSQLHSINLLDNQYLDDDFQVKIDNDRAQILKLFDNQQENSNHLEIQEIFLKLIEQNENNDEQNKLNEASETSQTKLQDDQSSDNVNEQNKQSIQSKHNQTDQLQKQLNQFNKYLEQQIKLIKQQVQTTQNQFQQQQEEQFRNLQLQMKENENLNQQTEGKAVSKTIFKTIIAANYYACKKK